MTKYTLQDALRIGPCALRAMVNVTGLSLEEIWEASKDRFDRNGLTPIDQYMIMKELGFEGETFWAIMPKVVINSKGVETLNMTVNQAEKYLAANHPNQTFICSINVEGTGHAISFKDGKFHNTLGAKKARIRLAYEYKAAA